jgi:Phage capsid family
MKNGKSSIVTAEAFRPLRVDENGAPDLVTGDAPEGGSTPAVPSSGTPSAPSGSVPHTTAPTAPPVTASDPAPPAPSEPAPSDPPPAPAPSDPGNGITTAEIVAALGLARAGQVHVTAEPSPYIEGGRIVEGRGFFADLYAAGALGDSDARRRAMQFQSQLRDYIAAASNDTANSANIIPPAWGGQWFVDQITQMRPSVGAFNSATITDNRPIPVPGFLDTTPAALVGDHVEGQPDTAGKVNFRQITVTPRAKSGRAEVSRELLDASPSLADRVISGALRESYAQITESTMAGVLEAGGTAGPAGGATAVAAEQAIRAALGLLPGTRFLPGRVILPSSHVWGALVGADGSDGRPLFPYLLNGPTNAAGTTATGYASGSIAGVETRPAWALDPGKIVIGAGPGDAMSFESSMLEFRFQEKSGPELVEFNVWGYFAGVVLQPKGVIVITSTVAASDSGDMLRAGNGDGESKSNGDEAKSSRSGK